MAAAGPSVKIAANDFSPVCSVRASGALDLSRDWTDVRRLRAFLTLQPISQSLSIDRVAGSVQRFAHIEASGGIVLVLAAALALVWANSQWADTYFDLLHLGIGLSFGDFELHEDLHFWVNDGLMAIFFFVVGLELKREFTVGELRSPKRAMLPIVAAIGGMLIPASIYAGFNASGVGASGWGIPMATDIAFAIGVLALLGRRVPAALKVFLVAVAIVDDLGAVLVIAVFYTGEIDVAALGWAALLWGGMWALWFLNIRSGFAYLLLAIPMWYAFELSGIHATVAGVLAAMTIPSSVRIAPDSFLAGAREALGVFERESARGGSVLTSRDQQESLHAIARALGESQPPLQRLETALHPWSTFFIVPIFAFANAGVVLAAPSDMALASIPLGIILGLFIGKPVGVLLGSFLAIRTGLATAPYGVSWTQFTGIGLLAGIGFTMSLFIAQLAFGDAQLLDMAKLGILGGSLVAGICGYALLALAGRGRQPAATAPEAGGYHSSPQQQMG